MSQFATIPPPFATPVMPPATPLPEKGVLTFGQAAALTALGLGLQILFGFFLGMVAFVTGLPLATPVGIGVGNTVAFAATLVAGAYWGRFPRRSILPLGRMPVVLLLPMTITVLALSVILSEISNLVGWLVPVPDFVND